MDSDFSYFRDWSIKDDDAVTYFVKAILKAPISVEQSHGKLTFNLVVKQ